MDNRSLNTVSRPISQGGTQQVPVRNVSRVPVNQNGSPMPSSVGGFSQRPNVQRGQQQVTTPAQSQSPVPLRQGTGGVSLPSNARTQRQSQQPVMAQPRNVGSDSRPSGNGLHASRVSSQKADGGKSKRGGVNSGSYMSMADKALRLRYLLDYLQQVKIAKKSDIARALGIEPGKSISTLTTALRHGYVEKLTNTGLSQAVYANTAAGNELTTFNVDGLGVVRSVNGQLEHTLGVARIASCLTSPLDEVPELWPGMYEWKDAVNGGDAWLIGESVMQNSWRTLEPASKTVSKSTSEFYRQYMQQKQSGNAIPTTEVNEKFTSYKYVIPPMVVRDYGNGKYGYKLSDNVYSDGRPMYNPTAGEKVLGYHVPDLVVSTSDSDAIAVEFERSAKSLKEYDAIMLKLLSDYAQAVFSSVVYLVPSRHIANVLRRKMERFPFPDNYILICEVNGGSNPFFSMSNEIHAGL